MAVVIACIEAVTYSQLEATCANSRHMASGRHRGRRLHLAGYAQPSIRQRMYYLNGCTATAVRMEYVQNGSGPACFYKNGRCQGRVHAALFGGIDTHFLCTTHTAQPCSALLCMSLFLHTWC